MKSQSCRVALSLLSSLLLELLLVPLQAATIPASRMIQTLLMILVDLRIPCSPWS